ncbi:hypothetical protein PVT68_05090 [Microbulbifer bruguierae]|uniref:Uncharacterized protein n=1 Tax=Microbulbifer bruguierae TaxID=3029061 RepID=A0ABY8NFF5_9GAMM|nr:hypothetical protein [Microbulbifer bruguierae]WGL17670.1 hypothetical protein PVT68_05090 [Microbulbifer bruguierae]
MLAPKLVSVTGLAATLLAMALLLAFSATTRAQQPGPFSANDFQFSGSPQPQIPPHLYGPDLDGDTPSEVALSAGAVRVRLQQLGFHSFGSMYFRNGYWNVVAYHGNKKRQLLVHPESGAIRSDSPYCNNRCNRYQVSDEF